MKKKVFFSIFYPALILLLIALYAVPVLGVPAARFVFAMTGYYLIFALFLLWVVTVIQCFGQYKPNLRAFFKSYGKGLLICLALVCIVFVSVKPIFRVLADETNLLAVSKSMLYEKKADNVIMGKWYYDNFYPVSRVVDPRPLLFPFFAYIIHALTGYRPENVFVLNFIVLFLLLFLIYKVIRDRLGEAWAACAVILVASQPIVSQGATCGGFELLFSLFIIMSFISLRWFMEKPEVLRFQLLWANLLLLSNVRYEGIIFFILVMLGLGCLKYLNNVEFFRKNMQALYAFTILALLLIWWQRFAMQDLTWVNTAPNIFSLKYLPQHAGEFLASLFDYRFFLPHASIVNSFALLAIFYFGFLYASGRLVEKKHNRDLISIGAVCMILYWVFLLSFIGGKVTHPSMGRYYMIFFVILSVVAAIYASRIKFFRNYPAYILVISAVMFLLYNPVSVEDRYSRTQVTPREFRVAAGFLERQGKKGRNILLITDRPNQYTVFNYGAVDFKYANRDQSLPREYNDHLYSDIFVLQKIEYLTQKPTVETQLSDRYILEKISETETDGSGFMRISKIISVKV
jgi:hypothetical protein